MNEPADVSATDCAYLAALVDHQGSIYVDRRKTPSGRRRLVLILQFTGISTFIQGWMKFKFPGASVGRFCTRYVTSQACAVLVRAFSYLKTKSKVDQAKLAFKFNEIKPSQGHKYTPAELDLRDRLADQIKAAGRPPEKVRDLSIKLPKFTVSRMAGS